MKEFAASTLLTGFALWVATLIVGGMRFDYGDVTSGLGKFCIIMVVAAIFGLVNAFVRPLVQFISIPLYILSLGLIHFVINALMLLLASWFTDKVFPWGLHVDGFWWAVLGSIVISLVAWVVTLVLPDRAVELARPSR